MKLAYKPFSIVARGVATRLGGAAFGAVWSRVADSERPQPPTAGRRNLVSVAATAALEAAMMAAIGAVVDQLAARTFHHLLGAWPEKPREQIEELASSGDPAA